MAKAGDELRNSASGERLVFRKTAAETNGTLLEMDDFWEQPGHRTAAHVHPQMQERWEVVSGGVRFLIDGVETVAGPGDVIVAQPGAAHRAWNVGSGPAHLRIQMRPALRWEDFVERLFPLVEQASSNPDGAADALLVLMAEFPREIALPGDS